MANITVNVRLDASDLEDLRKELVSRFSGRRNNRRTRKKIRKFMTEGVKRIRIHKEFP